jgi:hypothetical protein
MLFKHIDYGHGCIKTCYFISSLKTNDLKRLVAIARAYW